MSGLKEKERVNQFCGHGAVPQIFQANFRGPDYIKLYQKVMIIKRCSSTGLMRDGEISSFTFMTFPTELQYVSYSLHYNLEHSGPDNACLHDNLCLTSSLLASGPAGNAAPYPSSIQLAVVSQIQLMVLTEATLQFSEETRRYRRSTRSIRDILQRLKDITPLRAIPERSSDPGLVRLAQELHNCYEVLVSLQSFLDCYA